MQVTFYSFSKKINSTKRPDIVGETVNAVYLKDITDINNPVITVSKNVTNMNYAKIDDKYFFISAVESMTNNVWRVTLVKDLLATYKDNILNTNAYVIYSSSNYNTSIYDDRLNADANIITQVSSADVPGFPVSQGAAGYGIYGLTTVGYTTGDIPNSTSTVTFFLTASQMQEVIEALLNPDLLEWFLQYFSNPMGGIIEVFWLPFDVSQFTTLVEADVKIAGQVINNSEGNAIKGLIPYRNPSDLLGNRIRLEIPWVYDDFRNLAKNTTMNLFLPVVGNTELDPNLFYGETHLDIDFVLDWSTGTLSYDIVKGSFPTQSVITRLSGNAKTTIPIGQQQSSYGKLSQMVASLAIGAAFATQPYMWPAALTSFASANAVGVRRKEILQNGAFSGSFLAPNIGPRKAVLTIQANNTSDEPNNMQTILGRPCYKKLLLGSLNGYVQTQDVSVNIQALYNEINSVNSLLNGGIYIE